jgi:hypothetical protein
MSGAPAEKPNEKTHPLSERSVIPDAALTAQLLRS